MKLLIVDDEELTRTGLMTSINWASLGIEEIFQADDGVNGLEQARIHKPEIILCDVRMPRMDGITMLERLEKILPDSVPIFMSGYSDKEYLKAAIRLKAVNYIEKPLNPSEVSEAVREAGNLYIQKLHSKRGETLRSMETASQLALLLTLPALPDQETVRTFSRELGLSIRNTSCILSFIIKMQVFPELPVLEEFHRDLSDFLKKRKISFIHTDKKHQNLICFLFSERKPSSHTLQELQDFLTCRLSYHGKYSIAFGDMVTGISKAYQSYASAVILLQNSFFFPENTVLTQDSIKDHGESSGFSFDFPEQEFKEALESREQETALKLLEQLKNNFFKSTGYFQNSVKDLYYKLFLSLETTRKRSSIPESPDDESIADTIHQCFTFPELHEALVRQTTVFFEEATENTQEHPTIHLIKNYISQNYMDDTLSVKDISDHVFLSTSYVCTFFKNETGQTLNQYLTEYRMEKAKQLLKDARYRIADISSRVGYSDGNYFGKSFKKHCGISPSEYREQNLQ